MKTRGFAARRHVTHTACSLGLILSLTPTIAHADEIKTLAATAIEIILREIGPAFERATGHTIVMTVDLAPNFKRRIDAGETFDVALFSALTVDELVAEGRVRADTRTPLFSAGIGVAVRRGAPKPSIDSVDAFRRTLLNARSIAYLKEGPSGVYFAGLLQRLGIADDLKSKSTLADSDTVSVMIANGEAELGIVIVPNILNVPGAELVGPLPPELQTTIHFAGGVATAATHADAAMQLIRFLRSPAAIRLIQAKSMTPE